MVRRLHLLGPLLPLVFSILAFAFSLTSTTSKNWAYRRFYDGLSDTFFETPLYSQYRSPFQICKQLHQKNATFANGTVHLVNQVRCTQYQAWGRGKTSCELYSVTKNDHLEQTTTDSRLCQQIHMAGNLSIAGTSFIGLGLFFTLIMAAASIALYSSGVDSTSSKETVPPATSQKTAAEGTSGTDPPPTSTAKPRTGRRHRFLSPLSPYLNATMITFLIIGAILTVLAQFYGVLALTMSAPDNGKWTINNQGVQDQTSDDHEPWTQGTALTTYASLGWFFALVSATLAQSIWRLPRFTKVL